MTKKKSSLLITTEVFFVNILFLFTLNKVNYYYEKAENNHDVLKSLELNTVITNVAIGRQLKIKI